MPFSLLVTIAILTCVTSTPAYAYLDPGTGSMILQGLIGAIALGAAYLSIFWQRIKGLFSSSSQTKSGLSTSSEDASER